MVSMPIGMLIARIFVDTVCFFFLFFLRYCCVTKYTKEFTTVAAVVVSVFVGPMFSKKCAPTEIPLRHGEG